MDQDPDSENDDGVVEERHFGFGDGDQPAVTVDSLDALGAFAVTEGGDAEVASVGDVSGGDLVDPFDRHFGKKLVGGCQRFFETVFRAKSGKVVQGMGLVDGELAHGGPPQAFDVRSVAEADAEIMGQ